MNISSYQYPIHVTFVSLSLSAVPAVARTVVVIVNIHIVRRFIVVKHTRVQRFTFDYFVSSIEHAVVHRLAVSVNEFQKRLVLFCFIFSNQRN